MIHEKQKRHTETQYNAFYNDWHRAPAEPEDYSREDLRRAYRLFGGAF